MTQTTIKPRRFGNPKPQQEEVITEVELVEEEMTQEDGSINIATQIDNTTKRTRNIKKEEVVEVEEIEPVAKSVVKSASSVPRKLGFFVPKKVERIVEPVVEVNEIVGKEYLDKLSELFVQYAQENDIVIESQTEDGEVIATGINKDLSELLLSSFEDFFTDNILSKYDKVDFFGSRFEKHIAIPNFRKSAPSKTKNDGQDSYIYSEGDTKTVFQLKLESSPNRAYLYVNEDSEVELIERVNDKKETTEVTDGSLDYLIPELEKYIESKSK